MTTTPLPSYGIWTTDMEGKRVMGFTPKQFLSVWQARADLEAENQRLREALATLQMQCNSLAASNWREWQELSSPQEFERWAKSRAVHMEALARAALESKP